MIIAVDFDGTIVEHRYPHIGKEIPFAIVTLKQLQAEHHQLILWTVREGKLLDEAVEFCRERGLEFYAVNSNYPEDRNVGGLPDWGAVYEMVTHRWSYERYLQGLQGNEEKRKTSFWKRLISSK